MIAMIPEFLKPTKGKLVLALVMLVILAFLYDSEDMQFRPDMHYDSEPFTVERYSTPEIAEKAKTLGYVVRTGSAYSPPYKIYGMTSEAVVDNYGNISLESFEKFLAVYDEGYISLGVSRENYQFSASPVRFTEDPYTWRVKFISNKQIDGREATQIILDELKLLGVVSKDIRIRFNEGYFPPRLA